MLNPGPSRAERGGCGCKAREGRILLVFNRRVTQQTRPPRPSGDGSGFDTTLLEGRSRCHLGPWTARGQDLLQLQPQLEARLRVTSAEVLAVLRRSKGKITGREFS